MVCCGITSPNDHLLENQGCTVAEQPLRGKDNSSAYLRVSILIAFLCGVIYLLNR